MLDVRKADSDPSEAYWPDSEWVAFDDRVETFVTLPDDVDEDEIMVTYRPDEKTVEISGAYEDSIDTSSVSDIIMEDVTWQLSGHYLIISVPKRHDHSRTEESGEE